MGDALVLPARSAGRLAARPLLPAAGLALLACLLLAVLGILRIDTYHAGLLDLDIQDQVIWNTAHGRPFASTVLKENDLHLAEHLAFSITPLALLYAVAPNPRLVVLLQALALAGSSLPVFLYAQRRLGSPTAALVLQLCYLAMPLLAAVALDDVHPVALAALPLAWGAYLLLADVVPPGLALLALAVVAEEEAALPALGLGLFLAWRGRQRLGLAISLSAAIFLLLATQVVLPSFQTSAGRAGGPNRTLAHFDELRQDPGTFLYRLRPERLADVLAWDVLATGALPLASPASLLPAAPTFAALLLQDETLGPRYKMHWAAMLLPFLGFATVDGVRRLGRTQTLRRLALGLVVAAALGAYVTRSPLPGGQAFDADNYRLGAHDADVARALTFVPPDIPIQVSGTLVAYLNHRPEIYVYPPDLHYTGPNLDRARQVDYLVLDLYDRSTQSAIGQKRSSPQRRDPAPILFAPVHKVLFVLSSYPAPAVALDPPVSFSDLIALEGYDAHLENGDVALTLRWRALGGDYFPYVRTVELLADDGAVVASEPSMPLLFMFSTNEWRTGQQVIDRVDLRPAAPLGAGRYRFRVGWRMPKESNVPLNQLALPDGKPTYTSPALPTASSR